MSIGGTMSILIEGMTMPKNCGACSIAKRTKSGLRCPIASLNEGFSCSALLSAMKRPYYCPLVELPPHGDLVDRAEMREIAIFLLDKAVTDQEANAIREMWSHLGQMPVIIPADKDNNVLGKEEGET